MYKDALDYGGVWHDRWFATVSSRNSSVPWLFQGLLKGVGDLGLAAHSLLAPIGIGPGGRAPLLPSLATSAGMVVAAPLHTLRVL